MSYASTTRSIMFARTGRLGGAFASCGKRLSNLVTLTLMTAILAPAANAGDETWINPAIVSAIKAGDKSYTLPAGTYNLSAPIVIPAGTRNFSLLGAGSTKTLLTAPKAAIANAIVLGMQPLTYDNWGFAPKQCTNVAINNVTAGDTWITLQGSVNVVVGQYFVLYDSNNITMSTAPYSSQNNRRELVKIVAYNKAKNQVQIDEPAARDYNVSPTMAQTDSFTCANITVEGIGFNGSVTGSTTQYSNGVLLAGLTDKLTLQDLATIDYGTRSVGCYMCRNVIGNNIYSKNGLDPSDPGSAYGPTFCFCRFVTLNNSTSDTTRHGFVVENGSTDIVFNNCQTTGEGDIDAHGFDERRVTYNNCSSPDGIGFGNANWLGGEQNFTVNNCKFGGPAWLGANTNNITYTNSTFTGVSLNSVSGGTTGSPSNGYPNNITFNGCTFAGTSNLLNGSDPLGVVTFNNCVWDQTSTSWGNALIIQTVANLTFTNNTFESNSARSGDYPIIISTPTPGLKLTIKGGTVTSTSTAYGINLTKGLASSTISINNTVFKTSAKKVTGHLILNNSSVAPQTSNTN